ncbi:hypothetical protein, partial [Aeromonas salmonicida]|uniref:hypothetical protein n=1 Tax=Aeromonas salmonicida TaxID=645 RepID=UPI003D31BB0B
VLSPLNTQLQDTNDIFLGNMQKDGSYSVIPRMAGGEVTPEGLLAVAEVARDHPPYTHITPPPRPPPPRAPPPPPPPPPPPLLP